MERVLLVHLFACLPAAAQPIQPSTEARIAAARLDIGNLDKAVEYFKKKKGAYPAKLSDLQDAGYVEPGRPLLDPWKHPYQYDRAGKRNDGKKPDIWALLPDGRRIGNWPEKKDAGPPPR